MNTKTQAQITVEYERTLEDIIEFNLFHRANSPGLRRRELVTEVVVALLVFIGSLTAGYMLNFDKRVITGFSFVLALLLSFLPFFIFPYVNRADLIQQLRKLTKEGDNRAILGRQTISLTPDNIVVKAQRLESKCMWDSIDKIAQNDKYIFIYISSINDSTSARC